SRSPSARGSIRSRPRRGLGARSAPMGGDRLPDAPVERLGKRWRPVLGEDLPDPFAGPVRRARPPRGLPLLPRLAPEQGRAPPPSHVPAGVWVGEEVS